MDEVLSVTPPPWRFDISIEEDLIEEVARVIGYSALPDTPPLAPVTARVRPESRRNDHALASRRGCLGLPGNHQLQLCGGTMGTGAWRAMPTPSVCSTPLPRRCRSCVPALSGVWWACLKHNLARRAPRVRVFEIGRTYVRDATVLADDQHVAGVRQPLRVAGLAYGPVDDLQWASRERAVDFYDVKGDVEALLAPRVPRFTTIEHPALHPGRAAQVWLGGPRHWLRGRVAPALAPRLRAATGPHRV